MRLGKIGYYGDFVVYPVVITGLAAYAIWQGPPGGWSVWLGAFITGVAGVDSGRVRSAPIRAASRPVHQGHA